jgi:pyrroline-5-carboxylate reductase
MLSGAQPLLLVGAGKMGGAMLERWLAHDLDPTGVTILDPYLENERWSALAKAGVATATSVAGAADRPYRIVVLAVKPQSMAEALRQIPALAAPDTTIVSIAAGVRLATLANAFPPAQPIVRAMPNTPAQVGMSMTVAVPNANVTPLAREIVDRLFASIGRIAWIDDEALIDAVTAVSGSGPAYVFLLAECLETAAKAVGLPADLARRLARETVSGAGELIRQSDLDAAALRQNVTSPKGTTAAALEVLMGPDAMPTLLERAVKAARDRAEELAG